MRFFSLLSLSLIFIGIGIPLAADIRAQTSPLPGNSTFFTGQPPNLIEAFSPFSDVNTPDVPYFFTINLPEKSVESLGQVTIKQQAGPETIKFNLSQTQAFIGTSNSRGKALTLKSVTQDPKTGVISVNFQPPISPGTTFTISLMAQNNPSVGDTYLLEVNAFPTGSNPVSIDLGVGNFRIYEMAN